METKNVSFDSVAALIRELTPIEQLALVNSDNRPKIKEFLSGIKLIITLAGTVTVRPDEQFNKYEFFKVNTNGAPVKIAHVTDKFKQYLLYNFDDCPPKSRTTFSYYDINKDSLDLSIIGKLGGDAIAKPVLADIAALMQKQANSENGPFLTNGDANIFFVNGIGGARRIVEVSWFKELCGWFINADLIWSEYDCGSHPRVFCRIF